MYRPSDSFHKSKLNALYHRRHICFHSVGLWCQHCLNEYGPRPRNPYRVRYLLRPRGFALPQLRSIAIFINLPAYLFYVLRDSLRLIQAGHAYYEDGEDGMALYLSKIGVYDSEKETLDPQPIRV